MRLGFEIEARFLPRRIICANNRCSPSSASLYSGLPGDIFNANRSSSPMFLALQGRCVVNLGVTIPLALLLLALLSFENHASFARAADLIQDTRRSVCLISLGTVDDVGECPWQLPDDDTEGESIGDTDIHTSNLVRRVPPGVSALGNNQFQQSNIQIGETQWWYFPKAEVNGNVTAVSSSLPPSPSKRPIEDAVFELERREAGLTKRSATVYLSLTTCLIPTWNATGPQSGTTIPQLEIFVSISTALQQPGPGKDDALQTRHQAEEGYLGAQVQADGDVFIGVTAPNSTGYSGIYNYQIAASIDEFFHSLETSDPFLYFVDSDVNSALLVTNNLTHALPTSDKYKQLMNTTPPYTMFVYNINDSSLAYLQKSYCALQTFSQIGNTKNNVKAGMTSRGPGNMPKEQFYVTGLNRSSTYYGILAKDGNGTVSGNGIAGGGGKLFKPMNFTTKADNNCAIIYDLKFCSGVAYAVPSNPSLTMAQLGSIYDSYAQAQYQNFSYSLQQIQCNTSADSIYSLAVTCDDCNSAYKDWLCSVTIPRCADFSSPLPYLQVRNAAQPFLNGSRLPASNPWTQNPATNRSRNPIIDTEIKPGPYKEILPCRDICYDLVRKCPAMLGFGCPWGKLLNSSYGYRDPNGDVTCSYLGAAYYLSASSTIHDYIQQNLLFLGAAWAALWVILAL